MRKKIIYNTTDVLRIEPESNQYNSVNEGEYFIVQTLPLAKQMLQARGINTSVIDSYSE
jgi:hypothetical protein